MKHAVIKEEPGPFGRPVFRAYRAEDDSPLYMGEEDRGGLVLRLYDAGWVEAPRPCGDEIVVPGEPRLTCTRDHGHSFIGFNHPTSREYDFHEGSGWVWDDRCAWKKGEEPQR